MIIFFKDNGDMGEDPVLTGLLYLFSFLFIVACAMLLSLLFIV